MPPRRLDTMLENLVTHSDPQIIHAPGFDHAKPAIWRDVLRLWPTLSRKQYNLDSRLAIITWNNAPDSLVEQSLRHNGVKYYKIGGDLNEWNNLKKFELVVGLLKEIEAEYVIGLDSFDVVFFGDPNLCLERFLDLGLDLVFNAEIDFYPEWPVQYYRECKQHQRAASPGRFCYLNSGVWMGRRKFCLDFFSECAAVKLWTQVDERYCPLIRNCEQSVIHGLYRRHMNVGVDHGCVIVQNVAHLNDEVILNVKQLM